MNGIYGTAKKSQYVIILFLSCLTFFVGAHITHAATSVVFTPSRTTGVAPLSVFFDAASTTNVAVTSQPFHELDYAWDFDDPTAGVWMYGTASTSKNVAYGPITAHVFEDPGTYTVTLSVYDGTETVATTSTIIVTDPDVVFSGTDTICFSTAGTFTGCPSGAEEVTDVTGDFDGAIATYLLTNKRLLFNRGETWYTSTDAVLNVDGPWTLGAYGSGAKPAVVWTAGAAILRFGANGSNTYKDARVMDLVLDPGPTWATPFAQGAATFKGKFDQITFLRMDMPGGLVQDVINTAGLTGVWDQMTVVDSTVAPLTGGIDTGRGSFIATGRLAIMGCLFDNNGDSEHNLRTMYMNKMVISHNTFARPHVLKANLTLRGSPWVSEGGPIPSGVWNEYGFISDNKFLGASGVDTPVNTSIDASHETRTRHFIFERNWWTNQVDTHTALGLNSSYSTIRNNIFSFGEASSRSISISNNGDTQTPTDNWVYNNTTYTTWAGDAWGDWIGMRVHASTGVANFSNNLFSALNVTNTLYLPLVDEPSGPVTLSNNSTASEAKLTDPLFGNPSGNFSQPGDFIPTTGSYALAGGTTVPVYRDFYGNLRGGTMDMGAFKENSSLTDLVAPILSESTPIPTSTDTTPAYTFTTTESGTITYSGSCTSATTNATLGSNTITLNTLSTGTYSDCTITVTDSSDNASTPLSITSFTITAASSGGGGGGGGGGSSKKKTTATTTTTTATTTTVTTSSDPEIQRLLTLLAQLRAQLAILLGTTTKAPVSTITRDLELGMEGEDVRTLQQYLNTHGYIITTTGPGSPNNETTRFGPATHQAVIRYQNAHRTELGIQNGTGYVGEKTRRVMGL